MSAVDHRDWAYAQTIKPLPKFLLVTLVKYAGDGTTCFPSLGTLARETGMCRQSVIDNRATLIAKGLLSMSRNGGGRRSNTYTLLIANGTKYDKPGDGTSPRLVQELDVQELDHKEAVVVQELDPRGLSPRPESVIEEKTNQQHSLRSCGEGAAMEGDLFGPDEPMPSPTNGHHAAKPLEPDEVVVPGSDAHLSALFKLAGNLGRRSAVIELKKASVPLEQIEEILHMAETSDEPSSYLARIIHERRGSGRPRREKTSRQVIDEIFDGAA